MWGYFLGGEQLRITVKTVSAEHPSNKGKNKVNKKHSWHGNILNTAKKNLSRLQLSSWPRKRKLNLKLPIFYFKSFQGNNVNTLIPGISVVSEMVDGKMQSWKWLLLMTMTDVSTTKPAVIFRVNNTRKNISRLYYLFTPFLSKRVFLSTSPQQEGETAL